MRDIERLVLLAKGVALSPDPLGERFPWKGPDVSTPMGRLRLFLGYPEHAAEERLTHD